MDVSQAVNSLGIHNAGAIITTNKHAPVKIFIARVSRKYKTQLTKCSKCKLKNDFEKKLLNLLCPLYVQDQMVVSVSLKRLYGTGSIFTLHVADKRKTLKKQEIILSLRGWTETNFH